MIRILFTLIFIAFAQGVFASKAITSKLVVTLQDGTTRVVSLRGDEHFSFFASSRGELIIRENSTWRLATSDEMTAARIRLDEINSERQAQFRAAKKNANGIIADYPFPCTGTPKALVILVSFSDRDFEYSADTIKSLFNGTTRNEDAGYYDVYGSLDEFMDFCSDGQFRPEFDFAGPYQLPNTVQYYGQNSGGSDSNYPQFIKDACTAADNDGVDFSQYDSDGDGYVDLVYIVYAGFGENWSQNPDYYLWPKSGTGSFGTYDGKQVYRYGINQELAGYDELLADSITGNHYLNGIGVLAHEFCHTMGMFDVYPTASWDDVTMFDNQSMEYWSLMDNGENNLNGYWPTPLNAFERELFGWLTIDTLTEAANVSLKPLMFGGKAYKIFNDNDTTGNEFYILESIPRGSGTEFYHGMRGYGMLITHINYDANSFTNFGHPNNVHGEPRYTIVPADGIIMTSYRISNLSDDDDDYITMTEYYADHAGDTYPGTTGTTEFADYKAYTGEVDKPITAIELGDNFEVTFKFCGGVDEPEEDAIATIAAEQAADSPAFNLSGQRVNASYRGIIIRNGKKILVK